jgi:hypothetical protein
MGEFYANPHIISRSMGGITAAYSDGINNNVGQSVNFNNPATYSNFYLVTYDLGLTLDSRTLLSNTPEGKFTTNNFIPSYLAVGMPIKRSKGLGFAFGLRPLSSISYSVVSNERIAGDSLQTVYEGNGGLNQVFVGLGKKWKGLSIGFNTGVDFGRKETHTKKAFINDTVNYKQSKTGSSTSMNGVFLSFGMQYEFSLKTRTNTALRTTENYLLRFGINGTLQHGLNASQDLSRQTYIVTAAGDLKLDSVLEQNNVKGKVLLPATYSAGITFHKTLTSTKGIFELWSIGAEYSASKWSGYRFYDQPDKMADSWDWKLGIQISPDPITGSSYWGAVNYRTGVFFGKDPIDADGKGLKKYGVSFGAGLPIKKWRSFDNQYTSMNLAVQLGKRGSAVNNITENFLQFSIGMSFSDLWFVKRKYD